MDLALCVLVVPVAILALLWHKLHAASVIPHDAQSPDGHIGRPWPELLHTGSFIHSELAGFACYFGRLAPRPNLPPITVCPSALVPSAGVSRTIQTGSGWGRRYWP
jgi:hypothetical protein